jgi:hypothetical protein
VQCVETQAPAPSHTSPPFSLHATPSARAAVLQVCVSTLQTLTLQAVVGAGQSLAIRQATHFPVRSQTLPP